MFKNVASSFIVFAFDTTTGAAKTGDAANITAYVAKDYGAPTVLADTTAAEMDATNAKGYYLFAAAQGETNADCLMVSAKSATANISVIGAPSVIYTRPTTGWLAPSVAGRTLVVDAAGLADANMVKAGPTGAGTAQTTGDIPALIVTATGYIDTEITDIQNRIPAALTANGNMKCSLMEILTTALTETAGLLAAGFKKFFNVATPTGTLNSIPDAVPGAAGGIFIAGSNAATTANITGNITGNLSGSVGSVTGAVGSVTGAVGSVTGAVGSIAAGGITAASIATDAIDDDALAADAVTAIVNGVFTTAMTESYAADGATATLAQAIYMLLGREYEFAISGDTLTVKKLDGSTTAATFTLAPAGGPYTSITRAT